MTENYASTAYDSRRIPEQRHQLEDRNQGSISRKVNARLPWGNPNNVIPFPFFFWLPCRHKDSFKIKRKVCLEKMDNDGFVVTGPPMVINILVAVAALSLGAALIFNLIIIPLFMYKGNIDASISGIVDFYRNDFGAYIFVIYPLIAAVFCTLLIILVSFIINGSLAIPTKKVWSFNRYNGMVGIWKSKGLKGFFCTTEGGYEEYPFHEFDAWVLVLGDQAGPRFRLALMHRYRSLKIKVGSIVTEERTSYESYALWDFIQNYMDVSRPLPDIPGFEPYRKLDPTTREFDEATGRDEYFWRNKSSKEVSRLAQEISDQARGMDPFTRYNIMADKVQYYYKQGASPGGAFPWKVLIGKPALIAFVFLVVIPLSVAVFIIE